MVVTLEEITTAAGTVTLGSPTVVRTTIRDADTRILSVAPPAAVTEGDDAEFSVTLSGTVSEEVTVAYEIVPGSASMQDYTAPSGVLGLTSGTGTITVETTDDRFAEDSETLTLRLSSADLPDDVGLGIGNATATITDNDDLTASVTSDQGAVVEGEAGTFTVLLTRTVDGNAVPGAGSHDVLITYTVAGGTGGTVDPVEEEDYEAPDGTLTIPAGESTGKIYRYDAHRRPVGRQRDTVIDAE